MPAADRIRWDKIYRERLEKPYPTPDSLLFDFTPRVNAHPDYPLRALDLAGGFGQNALWLAAQGYTVDLMDISRVALNRARAEMAARNLRNINLLQVDMGNAELEPHCYDVICVFRYLQRDLFPAICAATRPTGRIIYETFNKSYLMQMPDFNPDFLLDEGELKQVFSGWNVLYYEENLTTSQFVAVKP